VVVSLSNYRARALLKRALDLCEQAEKLSAESARLRDEAERVALKPRPGAVLYDTVRDRVCVLKEHVNTGTKLVDYHDNDGQRPMERDYRYDIVCDGVKENTPHDTIILPPDEDEDDCP
jgi:hypothetical protein